MTITEDRRYGSGRIRGSAAADEHCLKHRRFLFVLGSHGVDHRHRSVARGGSCDECGRTVKKGSASVGDQEGSAAVFGVRAVLVGTGGGDVERCMFRADCVVKFVLTMEGLATERW